MTWRWDDDAYDAAESHGQHVHGSLDWYSEWAGPFGGQVFAAADRLASLSSRLLSAPEGLTSGSSPAQGHRPPDLRVGSSTSTAGGYIGRPNLCIVCDGNGCEFCPRAAA